MIKYIIFVCNFDYYKKGLALYEKRSYIQDAPEVIYDDGSHVLFLNAKFTIGNASQEILDFLRYVRSNDDNEEFSTVLANIARQAVRDARHDTKKGVGYMTWAMQRFDSFCEGQEKGRSEGRAEGRAEGRSEAYAEIVKRMLKTLTPEQITETIGLPLEKILEIQKTLKT